MADKLVIVESPAKARTINRILGSEYLVRPSMGHVRDLPERTLGVKIKEGFTPCYTLVKEKRKIVEELRQAAQRCQAVYLAPDPDREGEAIAWHLRELLQGSRAKRPFYRVQYNEITPEAVRAAFRNPGDIDTRRVEAQQARRILDRIVGYTVSPMLWRKVRRGLSAGRVQSVALRLVCEREREIQRFVPETYWILGVRARKYTPPLDPFRMRLTRVDGEKCDIKSEEVARRMRSELEGRSLKVVDVATARVSRRPPPPFITSTLQQAASGALGFSPSRTMSLAQRLYEGLEVHGEHVGLITYMRTDSVVVSRQAVEAARDYIREVFGSEYCPERPHVYKNRSGAQEAHEAIRPTDVRRHPDRLRDALGEAEWRLYRLIWERFVASQMAPADLERRTVKAEAPPDRGQSHTYLFQAVSSDVKFPGFLRLTNVDDTPKKESQEESGPLPPLTVGEPLECLEWTEERKETQPPKRYSEASLVRALEIHGIGRPSTYAQIISTLLERGYVEHERRILRPTELGLQVNDLLVANLGELFNVAFTARMEGALDEIEKGTVGWVAMLEKFYRQFAAWMENTREPPADPNRVREILDRLHRISRWQPAVQQNGRTYSDERFVRSVAEQFAQGTRPVTERQVTALLRVGLRHRDQLPDFEAFVRSIGRSDLLTTGAEDEAQIKARTKLHLLSTVPLKGWPQQFVASLRAQIERGQTVSPAQREALDRLVMENRVHIPDFEALRAELGLEERPALEDAVSGPLLKALAAVNAWRPATKKGRRVYDDRAFYESLRTQFDRSGRLSERQRAALQQLVARYRDQVPDYERLAAEFGLGRWNPRGRRKTDGASNGQ